jgi:hypothetical protein
VTWELSEESLLGFFRERQDETLLGMKNEIVFELHRKIHIPHLLSKVLLRYGVLSNTSCSMELEQLIFTHSGLKVIPQH